MISKKLIKKYSKRLLALFLVVVMSLNGYAAVVGDNDGSAFITKAEFDSLKNDFQSQIDQYNTSIDAKIDGAIAAYLAGIRVTTTETYQLPIENYMDMMWVNDLLIRDVERSWAAGATTAYSQSGWAWRQIAWNNVRNIRSNGVDLTSTWLSAGDRRQTTWLLHFTPNVEGNTKFGGSDFLSNRINQLAVPVMLLDLPLVNGYNVLKDGNNKLFIESMCEVYGNLNARWEEEYAYIRGDGQTDGIWNYEQNLLTTSKTTTTLSSDENYWLKLEAKVANGVNGFKLKSDGINYEVRELNEIPVDSKWTINQNFDAKAGTFAQPANWFIKANKNERNTGFLSVLDWYYYGGNIDDITNNRGNNYNATFCRAYLSDYQNFETILNDFMLGQDTTQVCNVGNQKDIDEVSGSTWRYDWSKSEWADLDVKFDFRIIPQPSTISVYRLTGLELKDFVYSQDTTSKIKWPLWPRMSVKDLRHSQYILNNEPLKVGQGLPLIINVPNNGILKMKFKYNVKNINSTITPSQKAKIYVKKNDFTTNVSSDYYENQATTTTTSGSLNGYVMETNNTLEFAIPVKKEDSVWMRLSPFDTAPSGLYASIDSIAIQIETE